MSFDIEVIDESKIKPKKGKGSDDILLGKKGSYYDAEKISYFYYEEYSRLLDLQNPLYKVIYLFLFETGARIQEARAAKYKDLDIAASKVKIKKLLSREARKKPV